MLTMRDIKVTQRGSQAYCQRDTNGNYICVNIPMIPDDASDLLMKAIQGYVDHECGHILFTDPFWRMKAQKEGFNGISNIIEDIYIEREMSKAFLGSERNMAYTRQLVWDEVLGKFNEKMNSGDEVTEVTHWQYLSFAILRAYGNQTLFIDELKKYWDALPTITSLLNPLRTQFDSLSSSEDVYHLAKAIQDALTSEEPQDERPSFEIGEESSEESEGEDKESEDEPDEESGSDSGEESDDDDDSDSGEGEEGADSDDDDDSDSGEGDSDDDSADDDESNDQDSGGDGDEDGDEDSSDTSNDEASEKTDDEGNEEQSGYEGGDDVDTDDETGEDEAKEPLMSKDESEEIEDFEDSLSAALKEMTDEELGSSEYSTYTTDFDTIEVFKPLRDHDLDGMEKTVKDMIGPIARQLERAFAAQSKAFWKPGLKAGRINATSLSRLAINDPRVFRKKTEVTTSDFAVSLVIDLSGSMHGSGFGTTQSKIVLAMETAWALADVLHRLNIPTEVIGFTTYWDGAVKKASRDIIITDEDKRTYDRFAPINMPIFKQFDESFGTPQKKRIAGWKEIELADNIDGESIRKAADRLLRRPEPGKAMFVLSDGEPACMGMENELMEHHLKKVTRDVERQGINLLGIGIGTDAPERYYRKSVILKDIEELPKTVVREITKVLLAK